MWWLSLLAACPHRRRFWNIGIAQDLPEPLFGNSAWRCTRWLRRRPGWGSRNPKHPLKFKPQISPCRTFIWFHCQALDVLDADAVLLHKPHSFDPGIIRRQRFYVAHNEQFGLHGGVGRT